MPDPWSLSPGHREDILTKRLVSSLRLVGILRRGSESTHSRTVSAWMLELGFLQPRLALWTVGFCVIHVCYPPERLLRSFCQITLEEAGEGRALLLTSAYLPTSGSFFPPHTPQGAFRTGDIAWTTCHGAARTSLPVLVGRDCQLPTARSGPDWATYKFVTGVLEGCVRITESFRLKQSVIQQLQDDCGQRKWPICPFWWLSWMRESRTPGT